MVFTLFVSTRLCVSHIDGLFWDLDPQALLSLSTVCSISIVIQDYQAWTSSYGIIRSRLSGPWAATLLLLNQSKGRKPLDRQHIQDVHSALLGHAGFCTLGIPVLPWVHTWLESVMGRDGAHAPAQSPSGGLDMVRRLEPECLHKSSTCMHTLRRWGRMQLMSLGRFDGPSFANKETWSARESMARQMRQ